MPCKKHAKMILQKNKISCKKGLIFPNSFVRIILLCNPKGGAEKWQNVISAEKA